MTDFDRIRKVEKLKIEKRCAVCGGSLRNTLITHEEKRNGRIYLFQKVPAEVCSSCGEIWIEEATLRIIDWLILKGKPLRKVETPVYNFARAQTPPRSV